MSTESLLPGRSIKEKELLRAMSISFGCHFKIGQYNRIIFLFEHLPVDYIQIPNARPGSLRQSNVRESSDEQREKKGLQWKTYSESKSLEF